MSDEAALLNAIYANPDEDTPRLMYADWLDEHGHPERAEFIRVQIELPNLEPWTERAVDLSIRELQLLHGHGDKWKAGLPLFAKLRSHEAEFRRGFMYAVSCTATQCATNLSQIARESAIQAWSLTGLTDKAIARLARAQSLTRVRGLTLAGGADALRTVLTSPHLTDLREFTLSDPCADAHETIPRLGAIFDARPLLSATRLQLRSGFWPAGAEEAIFRPLVGASFTRLRSLSIGFPHASEVPCEVFAAAPFLNGLVELDINTLGRGRVQYVEAMPSLPGLRAFRSGVWNVPGDVGRLLKCVAIQDVVDLEIMSMQDVALEAFLDAPFLERLRVLKCSVYSTDLFARLLDSGRLGGLLKLRIDTGDGAMDAVVSSIARTRGLPKLRHLTVSSRASDGVLDALTNSPNLPDLRMVIDDWGRPAGRFTIERPSRW